MRGVREDSPASDAVDAARERWPRTDDAWEAVKWSLARDPEDQTRPLNEAGNMRVFTSEGARSIGWPTIVVRFEFDARYVTIRDARFSDARAIQAGRA